MLKTKYNNIYDLYNEVKTNGFDNMSIREKIDISLGYPRVSLLLLASDKANDEIVVDEFSRAEYLEAYAERTCTDGDIENSFFGLDPVLLDDLSKNISDDTKKNMITFYKDVLDTTVEITNRQLDNEKLNSMIAFGVIMMDSLIVDTIEFGLDVAPMVDAAKSAVFKDILASVANDTLGEEKWSNIVKSLGK